MSLQPSHQIEKGGGGGGWRASQVECLAPSDAAIRNTSYLHHSLFIPAQNSLVACLHHLVEASLMAHLPQINWIEYQPLGLLGIGMAADIQYIFQCRTRVWDNTVAPWSIFSDFLFHHVVVSASHASRLLAEMHKLPHHSHFCAL